MVYSRVVFQTLVPKTCWYQLSPGRSCFSICREPQLDPGHHLANQQRWCGEQLAGLPNASAREATAEPRLLPSNLRVPLLRLHPSHSPVDTRRPRQKEHYMTINNPTSHPTSAHRPNDPIAYTPRVRSRLVLPPGVAAKPRLLSRQRNSSFMWWRSSAC